MPKTCQACGVTFPFSLKIGGKLRNLGDRKYCLDCSPFGSRNTRDPRNRQSGTIACVSCGRLYTHEPHKGHSWTRCNSCMANGKKDGTNKRIDRKKKAVEYKGGACQLCGYSRCLRALSFHHRDPAEKDMKIGASFNRSWEACRIELDKCVLVCANCHMEIHAGLVQIPAFSSIAERGPDKTETVERNHEGGLT